MELHFNFKNKFFSLSLDSSSLWYQRKKTHEGPLLSNKEILLKGTIDITVGNLLGRAFALDQGAE